MTRYDLKNFFFFLALNIQIHNNATALLTINMRKLLDKCSLRYQDTTKIE